MTSVQQPDVKDNCKSTSLQMEGDEEAEALAAEGMTQLAASRSAPASSSFGNVADISPLVALARSLIQISSQIPQQVGGFLCMLPFETCTLHQMYLQAVYIAKSSKTPADVGTLLHVLGSHVSQEDGFWAVRLTSAVCAR